MFNNVEICYYLIIVKNSNIFNIISNSFKVEWANTMNHFGELLIVAFLMKRLLNLI